MKRGPASIARRAALLAITLLPCAAGAAEPPASRPLVDVVVIASAGDQAALDGVIRELFARLPVDLDVRRSSTLDVQAVLTPTEGAAPRLARIWIDGRSGARATLFLADAKWERILVRHIPLPSGLDEVAREEVAQIAETSVGALLGGGTVGVTPKEARAELGLPPPRVAPASPARPAAPALPAPPAPPIEPALRVFTGYAAEGWSTASPLRHGPALGLGVHLFSPAPTSPWSARAALFGSYRLPTIVDGGVVGARLDQAVIRLAAGPARRLSGRWSAEALLGGGVDVAHVEPRIGAEPRLVLEPSARRVSVLGSLMTGVAADLSRTTRVRSMLTLDADLFDTRYVVSLNGAITPVLEPWRLRIGLMVGLDLGL